MAFGSRGKGAKAERMVAEHCTQWWWQIEPGVVFARTPSSGGWGKPQHREGFQTGGDLVTTSKTWPWAIEIKHRESFSPRMLELGGKSPVWGWWRQCIEAAKEMKKQPMLWFRKNHMPWHVMLPYEQHIALGNDAPEVRYCWTAYELMKADYGDVHPVCYLWDELKKTSPRLFVKDIIIPMRKKKAG